jgi:DNA-binding transcriptional MerR regulator
VNSLHALQYEPRDILRILGISRYKLFYWIKTHQLFKPEKDADSMGSKKVFSFKNLLEIAFIDTLVKFGIDLASIKKMKDQVDKSNSVFEKDLGGTNRESFDTQDYFDRIVFALEMSPDEVGFYSILVYRSKNEYEIELIERGYDIEVDNSNELPQAYNIPIPISTRLRAGSEKTTFNEMIYIRFNIGKMAALIRTKAI